MYLLAMKFGQARGHLSAEEVKKLTAELELVPGYIEKLLTMDEELKELAKEMCIRDRCRFCGAGADHSGGGPWRCYRKRKGELQMMYLKAFLVGGLICVLGQILIDRTKLTPARILVLFVCIGCVLGGLGIYPKLIDFAGAGATVPLTGFGNRLAIEVKNEVDAMGIFGIFTGGIKAAAGGLTAVILFAFLAALIARPKEK